MATCECRNWGLLNRSAASPCRLYVRGQILGYKRSKVNQYEHTSLIRLESVAAKEDTAFYLVRAAWRFRSPRVPAQKTCLLCARENG